MFFALKTFKENLLERKLDFDPCHHLMAGTSWTETIACGIFLKYFNKIFLKNLLRFLVRKHLILFIASKISNFLWKPFLCFRLWLEILKFFVVSRYYYESYIVLWWLVNSSTFFFKDILGFSDQKSFDECLPSEKMKSDFPVALMTTFIQQIETHPFQVLENTFCLFLNFWKIIFRN